MADNVKPDYTDMDWGPLIRERADKWGKMMEEAKVIPRAVYTKLRSEAGFDSGLLILPVHEGEKRGTLIVCAGGGFMFKSSNEAMPVAKYFHDAGFNAAILDYHVDSTKPIGENPDVQEMAVLDGKAAISYLHKNADKLGILADKVAIGGFSAGGMISARTATIYNEANPAERPDAALILYGAMSNSGMKNDGMFGFSIEEQAERAKKDPVRNIHPGCPPMFVFQTHADDPRHALIFCYQLACNGVPYEIHTFAKGPHGGALYNGSDEDTPDFPHTAQWTTLAKEWLVENGF